MESYQKKSDEELIILLKKRDELAFNEIYKRHWHLLYFHSAKLLANEEEAQDLVQDIFFSLWERSEILDIRINLRNYLYKSIRNKVFSLLRHQKVKSDFAQILLKEFQELNHTTIEVINEREMISLIEMQIDKLPPKLKTVFELSRKEFLSNKEIAERLNINQEAVKKRLHRTISILKSALGKNTIVYLTALYLLQKK